MSGMCQEWMSAPDCAGCLPGSESHVMARVMSRSWSNLASDSDPGPGMGKVWSL